MQISPCTVADVQDAEFRYSIADVWRGLRPRRFEEGRRAGCPRHCGVGILHAPSTSSMASMSSCMVASVSLPMLEMRKVVPLILP